MNFRAYFALAENEGIDLVHAAEELLKGAKSSRRALKIAGLRRQWDLPSDAELRAWSDAEIRWQELAREREGLPERRRSKIEAEMISLRSLLDAKYDWRERLPRDPQLRIVPKTTWAWIEAVTPDLQSIWIDEPGDPEQSVSVDWLSGTIVSHFCLEHDAYNALCVDSTEAMKLIKRLAGSPEACEGPTSPPNRQLDHDEIIQRASELLADQPLLSIGSAAASIVVELPPNARSGKPRDQRHIERMIAHLWEGDSPKSPL